MTIRPIEPGQPFGAVAVVGDGSQRTEVTYLELSGGSDAWLDGAQFAGALSIHYQDRCRCPTRRFATIRALTV